MNCSQDDLIKFSIVLSLYAIFEYFMGRKSSSLLGIALSFIAIIAIYIIEKWKERKNEK